LLIGIASLFILLNLTAAVTDFKRMEIPNYISICLVTLFPAFLLATNAPVWVALDHLIFGLAMFAIGFGLFAMNAAGGGDVKLMAAVSLWIGLPLAVPFILAVTIFGAILGLSMVLIRRLTKEEQLTGSTWMWRRLKEMAHDGVCPYGLAIVAGAIVLAPLIFT
jgi:prepilin peptidase CpaA